MREGRKGHLLGSWFALCLMLGLSACGSGTASGTASTAPLPRATALPSPRPSPTAIPPPTSWLHRTTILSIYGRAFGIAPILGRLGMDNSFADLHAQVQPYLAGIRANNGGKATRVAVHLIYGLATPCSGPTDTCLAYLDDSGVDIVKDYIKPAAQRGWLVVLDTQLAHSSPLAEVQRMGRKGYLRYDNVVVALDPEFRAPPDQLEPGVPVGTVTAGELNAAQRLAASFVTAHHLRHHKIVMVHQFRDFMIVDRQKLRTHVPNSDLIICADGFGTPDVKASVYDTLLRPKAFPRLVWRSVKLFLFNSNENAGHGDYPEMTWPQVLGRAPAIDPGGGRWWMLPAPAWIVIA